MMFISCTNRCPSVNIIAVYRLSLKNVAIGVVENVAWSDTIYTFLTFRYWQNVMQIFIEDKNLIQFGHLLKSIPIQLTGFCEVSCL